MSQPRPSIMTTARGTRREAFGPVEWGLMVFLALTWGASFVLIAVGLDAFEPGVVTMLRVGLGAVTLAFFPGARRPIDRADWPRLAVIAATWTALPFTLFPIAQQWINSAVAGMLNGAMPILAALVASLLLRSLPGRTQAIGLGVGFVGIVLISAPTMGESESALLGVVLVMVAVVFYAISVNIVTPLQQRYGSVPVIARMLWVATVMTLPFGLGSVAGSSFSWASLTAVVVLGVAGTGLAYVAMAELAGRAGGTRASTVTYLIPVVAVGLGILFRGDRVTTVAFVGIALVIAGAIITSRREA